MEASPSGLMALTAGGVEYPEIGARMTDLNIPLGITVAGLRWKTGTILAFAHNTDQLRTVQYDLAARQLTILRDGGWNDLFAGGDVAAAFDNRGYWDSTGLGRSGNQRPVAVDDQSGSIAIMREDRSGLDVYVGADRLRIFDGPGNYGACFRQRVLHFLYNRRMYRWAIDAPEVQPLFDLPPWIRPICQYSGGWFLSWHDNWGGVIVWPERDLAAGRGPAKGGTINDPRLMRVGDELHVLFATGAGELLGEGQRRVAALNDLSIWPAVDGLNPDPPAGDGHSDPPAPPPVVVLPPVVVSPPVALPPPPPPLPVQPRPQPPPSARPARRASGFLQFLKRLFGQR